MEGPCLRSVPTFRRLAVYPSGPSDFTFCIDKALVHAPFKSQDNVFLSMYPFLSFLVLGLGSPARHFPKICGGIFPSAFLSVFI